MSTSAGMRGGVGASNYHAWRSADVQLHTAVFAGESGGTTSMTDSGAQSLPGLHVYKVRSANSCRWESN